MLGSWIEDYVARAPAYGEVITRDDELHALLHAVIIPPMKLLTRRAGLVQEMSTPIAALPHLAATPLGRCGAAGNARLLG